ncbi:MAG: hypothetical protein WC840_04850 [Candidatus Peribacteraceae bacterium]
MAKKDDFDLEAYARREDFEGAKFYEKVATAISKSRDVEQEIRKIVWETFRNKIWAFIIALVVLILTDLTIRALPLLMNLLPTQ